MSSESSSSTVQCVENLAVRYPDIPIEAIVKEDLLRRGMCLGARSSRNCRGVQTQGVLHLLIRHGPDLRIGAERAFKSSRRGSLIRRAKELPARYCFGSPESRLSLPRRSRRGLARIESRRPDGRCHRIAEIAGLLRPTLASGKPIADIAPTIEWGYLLYLTAFRLCQYFGAQEECQFCDINENYRQQKKSGRPYTSIKSVEEVMEALEIIASMDTDARPIRLPAVVSRAVWMGSPRSIFMFVTRRRSRSDGLAGGSAKWSCKPFPKDEVQRLYDAGVQVYHPNFEIWDKRLFELYCPGKARYIGRDEWIRRILDAAAIFGPDRVIPNFVAGVEMAPPAGFRRWMKRLLRLQKASTFL